MASVVHVDRIRSNYHRIVRRVITEGVPTAARGLKTLDLGPTLIIADEPYDALPTGVGRGVDPAIAALEAAMLIGAHCDEAVVERVAPRLMDYADSHVDSYAGTPSVKSRRLHGAYGRRLGTQLTSVVNKLREDASTRQAVVTLWDSWLDNQPGYRDYPCTVALQFRVIAARLELYVTMRSNDVWRGLPYDVFQFTQLQLTVARVLNVDVGPYHHMAWSLHLYDTDLDVAFRMLDRTDVSFTSPRYVLAGLGRTGDCVGTVQSRARSLLAGARIENETGTEAWYREHLHTTHVG